MSSVIKIERVDINVSSNGQTYRLQNDVGTLDNAFVRIVSSSDYASGGPIGNNSNAGPRDVGCGVQLTATDTLTFYLDTTSSATVKMMVEVWRYTGSPGGKYEFISRGNGVMFLLSGSTSISETVNNVQNRNKLIPFHQGWTTPETLTSQYETVTLASHIDSNGDVVFSRNNTGGSQAIRVYYQVVEFTGSAWNVGYGVSNNHDSTQETVTLNTDSTGTGGSTFDVTDWSTAMIINITMEGDSSETGLSDCLAVAWPGPSTTQVYFSSDEGDNNAANDGTGYVHVLQCDDLIINRRERIAVTEGDNSYGLNLELPFGMNLLTPTNEMSLEWFVDTSGTGTAHARGRLVAKISDPDDGTVFNDGDDFSSSNYDSTALGRWVFYNVTFPATPQGILVECGGTGTGMVIGFNNSGEMIARGGGGGSLDPDDCARVVIPSSTYNFANKTGRLEVVIDPTINSITFGFDENDTGSFDYTDSDVSVSNMSNWSGGDNGKVGDIASTNSVAGSEHTVVTNFNGTIGYMIFNQQGGDIEIAHWVHRQGNNIIAFYGVSDLSALEESVTPSDRRIFIM